MKLQAGLTAPSPGWELFLNQEKPAFIHLEPGPWKRTETPVIIVTGNVPGLAAQAERFVSEGGSLVTDTDSLPLLPAGLRTHPRVFKLQRSVKDSACDSTNAFKHFNSSTPHPVEEICAREPKRVLKKIIREALTAAFAAQGLPFVRLDYYPEGYRSVFLFRIDLDEYDPNDFSELCDLLSRYGDSMSCFPCMKTYEYRLDELERAVHTGAEFGSHAYIHHVYQTERQNDRNLSAAETLLKKIIPEVLGFSGPHGYWHPSLQTVLEKRGYVYSSEFSLDYDNFPFYPVIAGRSSNVLQIPVHPVCEGVFLQVYPYDEIMFRTYFERVISERVERAKPILIFGHPTRRLGRYPAIVHNLYRDLENQPSVWKIQFHQWAGWWRERSRMTPVLEWDDKSCQIVYSPDLKQQMSASYGDACFRITSPAPAFSEKIFDASGNLLRLTGKKESSTDPEDDFDPGSEIQFPLIKRLKQTLKHHLDWETKTPVEQLFVTDFPSAMKVLMRRVTDPVRRQSTDVNRGGMA